MNPSASAIASGVPRSSPAATAPDRAAGSPGSRPGLSSAGTSICACSRKARSIASSTSGSASRGSSAGDSCGQAYGRLVSGCSAKATNCWPRPEHLDRVRFHAGDRLGRAVDQQPLGRHADPHERGVAEPLARQLLEPARERRVVLDIEVDADHGPGRDADAGVRPLRPDGQLMLGCRPAAMLRPAGVVAPGAALEQPGLLGAGHDRQDRIAVVDQPRPEPRHVALAHGYGTSPGSSPSWRR